MRLADSVVVNALKRIAASTAGKESNRKEKKKGKFYSRSLSFLPLTPSIRLPRILVLEAGQEVGEEE